MERIEWKMKALVRKNVVDERELLYLIRKRNILQLEWRNFGDKSVEKLTRKRNHLTGIHSNIHLSFSIFAISNPVLFFSGKWQQLIGKGMDFTDRNYRESVDILVVFMRF